MRPTRLRRALPLIPLLAVAAACGESDAARDDASASLSEAAAFTLDVPTMSFHLAFRIDGPDVDESGALAGQADFAANRGTVSAVTNGSPESRAIIDGDEFFLQCCGTLRTSPLPEGKEWVHAEFEDVGDDAMVSPIDVPAILYLFDGAQNVAAERHGDSTRYTFDVDMTRAAERAPAERRDEVEALIDTGTVEPEVRGDAIVDADGLVRELAVAGSDGQDPTIEITWKAQFDDFGEPIDNEPPDDDEVVELDEVPAVLDQVVTDS